MLRYYTLNNTAAAVDASPRATGAARPIAGARPTGRALLGSILGSILASTLGWIVVSRQRRALAELDKRLLQDIGISSADARHEAQKPFWRR